MNRRRISLSTASAAAIALAVSGGIASSSTAADPPSYVALGDSFSAGTGAGLPTDDDCYLSPNGYPHVIADAQGLALDYQACSGATTADVLNNQLGTLSADTDYVTMTIGGNDLGFASVITDCLLPSWLGDCFGGIEEGREILNTVLPDRYDNLFGTIDAAAPNADVRIGGYPYLFNGQDCHALTFFSEAEMAELNAATGEMNDVIADHTAAAGFTWVDPTDAFLGHAVCDDEEWINNLSLRVVDSFHPNIAGNIGYAEVFWPGTAATATSEIDGARADEAPSVGSLDAVNVEAATVIDMQLTSPENLAAAEAAGIDTDALVALEADLRSDDPATIEAALDELAAMDAEHQAELDRAAH